MGHTPQGQFTHSSDGQHAKQPKMIASKLFSSRVLRPSIPSVSARLLRPLPIVTRRFYAKENEGLAAELLRKKMATEAPPEEAEETQREKRDKPEAKGNMFYAWSSIITMGSLGVLLVAGLYNVLKD